MTPDQASAQLQRGMKIDVEKIATAAGANEHNVREEWDAISRKASEFHDKYIAVGSKAGSN